MRPFVFNLVQEAASWLRGIAGAVVLGLFAPIYRDLPALGIGLASAPLLLWNAAMSPDF